MAKPYDATLKALLEMSPEDWPVLLGLPAGATRLVDSDTSAIISAADKVIRVAGPPDWMLHIEFQAGPDASLPRRMHRDNAILEERHEMPVLSAAILLAPKANLRIVNGLHEQRLAGETYLTFRYRLVRVWELPAQRFLEGGPGLLPLALVSAAAEQELPGVVEQMKQRLSSFPKAEAGRLWTAAYIIMGLCHSVALANRLLEGVVTMEESVTYQAIISKGLGQGILQGTLQGERKLLLLQGTDRFGEPSPKVLRALNAIKEPARLDELGLRLLRVGSWEELLEMPDTRSGG